MTRQAQLGELEQLTLLAVARLGEDAYGTRIRQELEDTAGRSVTIATVYVTLVRLEEKGYLSSWRSDPTPVRGGKAKRFYDLTPEGAEALRETHEVMERMWSGLETHRYLGSS